MEPTTQMLVIRKLADRSEGRRLKRFNPLTGDSILVDPDDPEFDDDPRTYRHSPWPLAGVEIGVQVDGQFDANPPQFTKISTKKLVQGRAEGWIEVEGERVVHATGGPDEEPWRVTHTFVQVDAVIFKALDGDVRYRVIRNPGKYEDDSEPSGKQVHWSYKLQLDEEGSNG